MNDREFIERLLDPEGYGFAVSAEVRDAARRQLGLEAVETIGVDHVAKLNLDLGHDAGQWRK